MRWLAILGVSFCATSLFAQLGDRKWEAQSSAPSLFHPPPAPVIPAEEAVKTIHVPPGFRVELVASEPMVQDPVAVTFDEDGRLWVVEMRGYMPTLDGKGETNAVGRISILEDTDGDGRMDKSTVFLDHLVLPRAIARVRGGVLFVADAKLWFAPESETRGHAGPVSLVDGAYAIGGTVEHQPNGLALNLDNWLYNAKSRARYRWFDDHWAKEATEFRGQWGLSQDDFGRLFYNVNDNQLRGDIAPPNYLMRNPRHVSASGINVAVSTNQFVFPIRMSTGVNRGYRPGILDAQGRLREFTAACAPTVYRGGQFPAEFDGNVFVCEPAGNLIKRNLVFRRGLELTSAFAYPDAEFLASTDERFRPVNACGGPDGALYVVDMYRGVIQYRDYMTSYLRREIVSRELEQHINLGRIYRVVHADARMVNAPRLSQETSAQLVAHLGDPNGWWRDTAQRLLVERDNEAVIPALLELAAHGTNRLARIHALWTLEGFRSPQVEPLLALLDDPDSRIQATALRVVETLSAGAVAAQRKVCVKLREILPKADPELTLQIALSAGSLPRAEAAPIMQEVIATRADQPLFRDGILSGLKESELAFLVDLLGDDRWREPTAGRVAFLRALAGAVVSGREPEGIETLLTLTARQERRVEWRRVALLAGVADRARNQSFPPITLERKPAALSALTAAGDGETRRLAREASSLFSWPGHLAARARGKPAPPLNAFEQKQFTTGKLEYSATCSGCHGPNGEGIPPLAPPLAGSNWASGPEQRLVRIVLHGLEAPIHVNGVMYQPPQVLHDMPPLEVLGEDKLAAVLTYVRREWGNQGTPVNPATVAKVHEATLGRQNPWTEAELLKLK